MKTLQVLAILFSLSFAAAFAADTVVYVNGDVLTIDESNSVAEALAVRDGNILAVGSRDEVMKAAGAEAEVRDLGGKTLMPGFFDAHSHLFTTALARATNDLNPPPMGTVDSIAKLEEVLLSYKEENNLKPGQWILGMNYDDTSLEEMRHPTRNDLDAISTENPILIVHISGHLAVANSPALEIAGINSETIDPPGGKYVRRPNSNEPNGVMEEPNAFLPVVAHLPAPAPEVAKRYVIDTLIYDYAANGMTTAQEGALLAPFYGLLRGMAAEEKLPVDVLVLPKADTAMMANYEEDKVYHNGLRIAGLKLLFDGSNQGYTGYLSQPYYVAPAAGEALTEDMCDSEGLERILLDVSAEAHDDETPFEAPAGEEGYRGWPIYEDQEEADALVEQALKNGWHLAVHCNGDAAIDQYIEAMRKGLAKYPVDDHRYVIIHAQTIRDDQLDAAKELGLSPSFFPGHIYYWGDRHRDIFMGPERAARMNPMRSALDRGVPFSIHHDAYVTPPSVIDVVAFAVNRVTSSGEPLGTEQELTVEQALRAVTIDAAWQYGEEDSKGSLEAGKLADLIILSANPLEVDKTAIRDIRVLETIKEGKTIYTR
ncbi:MAG: amidohydrolase [Candidatus Zixiibacteriota bacterium]